jgi:hypothetical protein
MGMYLLKKYKHQFYHSHPNPYSGKAVNNTSKPIFCNDSDCIHVKQHTTHTNKMSAGHTFQPRRSPSSPWPPWCPPPWCRGMQQSAKTIHRCFYWGRAWWVAMGCCYNKQRMPRYGGVGVGKTIQLATYVVK